MWDHWESGEILHSVSKLHTISVGASGEVAAGVDRVVCWAMEPAAAATTNRSPGFVDHHISPVCVKSVFADFETQSSFR